MYNSCMPNYCYYPCVYPGPPGPAGPAGPVGPTGAAGPTGATGAGEPFLSNYLEAVGNTQERGAAENIVFDINPDFLDIVGGGVSVNAGGDVFTITKPGLYSVEWSLNIARGATPVLVGLTENGQPASVMTNSLVSGNLSSGALINVTAGDVPYEISLQNLGGAIRLENLPQYGNTSASIRIFRFAGGPEG